MRATAIQPAIDAGRVVALDVPDDQRALLQPVPIVIANMRTRPLPPIAEAVLNAMRGLATP